MREKILNMLEKKQQNRFKRHGGYAWHDRGGSRQ